MLVTAGAGGVGAAIARAFHAAGSCVHVCDIDRSALDFDRIYLSGGERGVNLHVAVPDLLRVTGATPVTTHRGE